MFKFAKDLILGEPALSLGIIASGLGAWLGVLVGMGETVPLWLAIATPSSSAVAAIYTRQSGVPTTKLPEFADVDEDTGHGDLSGP